MIKGPEFIKAVDAFIAAPKSLAGADDPQWVRSERDIYKFCLKLPIEVDDELSGQKLLIQADPTKDDLVFSVGILFLERCICRIDFDKGDAHFNHWHPALPHVAEGSHWHSWELNKNDFKKLGHYKKLRYASEFRAAKQFDATLRWYCQERNIDLGAQGIDFPEKGGLI